MSSIFNESTIGGFINAKKWLFRFAVGLVIAAVVFGVIVILVGDLSQSTGVLGKTVSSLFVVGLMLVMLTVAFRLIESRRAVSQIFALIGGVFSLFWTIFSLIYTWAPTIGLDNFTCNGINCYFGNNPIQRIASVAGYMSLFGLICGGIMNIYEGKRKDVILPMKITSAVLAGYEFLYFTIITIIGNVTNERFAILTGFAAFIWIVLLIVTIVMSKNEKKRNFVLVEKDEETQTEKKEETKTGKTTKSDDELRAEIEEQVRKEMIEKEVRARMEKEQSEKK